LGWGGTGGRRGCEGSSFSEEKEAKRLLFSALAARLVSWFDRGSGAKIKVFWFFSSEKNILA
jgi:hypothetical protein